MANSRNRKPPEQPPPGRPETVAHALGAEPRRGGGAHETDVTGAVAAVLAAAGVGATSRLCVALSGGVDSVVLLHTLAALRARVGYALTAAHVHHGLSVHADDWRAFCRDLCAALAVDFQAFEVVVPVSDPDGLEAAARRERQRALRSVPADWLVFGHHQDDQAETVLFRLLRGTGVRGMTAMASIEGGAPGRLRPLLGLRRAELVAHARARGFAWVEDESNADRRFTRNRLRHEVLPAAEAVFPSAVAALARAAEHFREADALLDALAEQDAHDCGGEALALEAVLAMPDARVRNLLRWKIRRAGAEAPSQARLDEALRQLRQCAGKPLQISLGALACCAYRGRLWLEAPSEAPLAAAVWRGEPSLLWGGGRIAFETVSGGGLSAARLGAARECAVVPRWEGLVMRVGAGRPRRSFRKLCQQAGVPAWLRARLPVLRVDGVPAWIGGIGVAAEFACARGEAGVLPHWLRGR